MNAFEKYQSLTNHIERMASTGTTGNMHEWNDFLFELNKMSDIKNLNDDIDVETLRDQFAMVALQKIQKENGVYAYRINAAEAYEQADAMLEARKQHED